MEWKKFVGPIVMYIFVLLIFRLLFNPSLEAFLTYAVLVVAINIAWYGALYWLNHKPSPKTG